MNPLFLLCACLGNWLAIGDSITVGYGASDYAHAWVSLVSDRIGQPIDNHAVNGAISQGMIDQVTGNYENVVWMCCINDNQFGISPAVTQVNVAQIIDLLNQHGAKHIYLAPTIPSSLSFYSDVYNQAVVGGTLNKADVSIISMDGYDPAVLSISGLHPNDSGHRFIADRFIQSIFAYRQFLPFILK